MISDRAGRLALLLAGVGVAGSLGCGGAGVHDLSIPSSPLEVLHGHVDVSSLSRPHPNAALLGVLVWAAVPGVNPVCTRFADGTLVPADSRQANAIRGACPDPFGVFPGEAALWTPIGADGSFDLSLYELPLVRVSVGDETTRIAYGTLMVVEDVNGDGNPPFVPMASGNFRRDVNVRSPDPDQILAATFHNLRAAGQRIVFREGGFVRGSYFYPGVPADCDPPPGFSVLSAPPYSDPTFAPPSGPCVFTSTDERLEVPALASSDATALLCRAIQIDSLVRQPTDENEPSSDSTSICFDSNVMAAVYTRGICSVLRSYALSACQQDPLCATYTTPEWTVLPSSIPWTNGWPCP